MKNRRMLTGLGLDSEWSADLQIGGAPDNPAITGRPDLIRGDYEFAGREFELDRGIIRFAGEVPANPAPGISANGGRTGLHANNPATGHPTQPHNSFHSLPAPPADGMTHPVFFR